MKSGNELMYSSDSDDGDGVGVTHVIHDQPVVCRALASLPMEYLTVRHSGNSKSKNVTGVFARNEIPPKTVFGPLEGTVESDDGNRATKKLHYLVEVGGSFQRLNTSNEFLSNWMKFVKPAKSYEEQNLSLHQKGKNLYFTTIRWIRAKEELKVWYSGRYASSRNVGPVFIPVPPELPKSDWSMSCISVDYQPLLNELTENCWSCTHCVMKFDNATLLNFHMLTHAADNIETNELAELTNEEVNFAVMNISSQNALVENPDEVCDSLDHEVENSPSQVTTKAKILECPMCKEVFNKLAHLKEHVHSHAKDGLYTCPTCSKIFRSYKHIRNHIRIYHRERRFICEMCSKRFPTQDKLKHHKLSHTGHKPYLCSDCGRQFRRRDKLINHIRRFHEDLEVATKKRLRPTRKKSPKRSVGGCESGQVKECVYKCEECAICFKRRGMLVNHLAKCHPEVNPETVPELKLPIVKPNKDYFCQYCERVYKSTSKRKAHILKNHPGKQVPPNERESKMNKVEQSGQPNELSQQCGSYVSTPQSCEWCYKQYATRAKLLQHQRQKHLDLMPKSLQEPKKASNSKEEFEESDDLNRADEGGILLLQNPLEDNLSEYEFHLNDSKLCGDGEFIIDAPTLRKVLKGDALTSECSSEALAELGQILDTRPDQYFRILQTSNGISFARPVEVWDPCEPLSPEAPDGHHLLPQ